MVAARTIEEVVQVVVVAMGRTIGVVEVKAVMATAVACPAKCTISQDTLPFAAGTASTTPTKLEMLKVVADAVTNNYTVDSN